MRHWTRKAAVAFSAAALFALAAPAASASETGAPAAGTDAADCTTVLLGEAGGWVPSAIPSHLIEFSYTPPTTVYFSADRAVGVVLYVVNNVTGDVYAYVDCVV